MKKLDINEVHRDKPDLKDFDDYEQYVGALENWYDQMETAYEQRIAELEEKLCEAKN